VPHGIRFDSDALRHLYTKLCNPNNDEMNYITTKANARKEPHFAALVFSTVHIPGDERSRTNPGHGYPAENKPVVEYIAFDSRVEMQTWVDRQESDTFSREDYQLIAVNPLVVNVKTTVSIS
jgi:hypothetical protein